MYNGLAVGLAELFEKRKADPDGRFYLILLSDGASNQGINLQDMQEVLKYSDVRMYPIAYGSVNLEELEAIAAVREGNVYDGDPETVQTLLKDLFQTNL
jgi:Ca-activated chloride channel homolog